MTARRLRATQYTGAGGATVTSFGNFEEMSLCIGELQCCQFVFIHLIIYRFVDLWDGVLTTYPQWGAADAEIKVPSGENTELKRFPFKAWSRSVYSHTCCAYCQGFLSCLFLHFRSIHLHFFQNLSRFFPVLAVANTWFLCRPAE